MEILCRQTVQNVTKTTFEKITKEKQLENTYNGQKLALLLELPQPETWTLLYKTFLEEIKNIVPNIFVQESQKQRIVLITVLGKFCENMTFSAKRNIISKQPPQNGAILLDLWNFKIISTWSNYPQEFDSYEIDQICQALNDYQENKKIDYYFTSVPIGLRISLSHIDNDWNISTRNTIRVNESKLIGNRTIEEALQKLLNKNELNLKDLNKNYNYKFQINLPEYQVVPSAEYIFLTGIYDGNDNDLLINIPKNQCLIQQYIKQFTFSHITGNINYKHITRGIHRYSGYYPTQMLQITAVCQQSNTQQLFTIRSHLAEVLDYIRENSADKNTQKIKLNNFIQQFSGNKYIKEYMNDY